MTKSLKNRTRGRADDQVADRLPRSGSWRCRPCGGDYVSPSPKPSPKVREDKKKPDFLNDPLFIKPIKPTPAAREDNLLPIEPLQEGHAKENGREEDGLSRGKVDGQLQRAPQQDQGELKPPDGNIDEFVSPRFSLKIHRGHLKAESFDLFELDPDPTVLDEGAGDAAKDLVSTQSSYKGETGADSKRDPLRAGKGTQLKDLFKIESSGGDHEQLATLNSDPSSDQHEIEHPQMEHHQMEHPQLEHPQIEHPQIEHPQIEHPEIEHPESPRGQDTVRNEGSATGKTGLNINIPQLGKDEGEKVKALEETESPVSVLEGLPELETPKAESGEVRARPELETPKDKSGEMQARIDNNSTQSAQGIAKLEPQPNGPLRLGSSTDIDPASNDTHPCADSQLVAEKLESPFDNVQTDSRESLDVAKSDNIPGTSQADFDSLQQDAPTPESSVLTEASKESQGLGFREDGKEIPVIPKTEGSLHGEGENSSNLSHTEHHDKTDLHHSSHPEQASADIHQSRHPLEESRSFRLGYLSVPPVLVMGAITVISILGKAR